jgi:hypothetical protein
MIGDADRSAGESAPTERRVVGATVGNPAGGCEHAPTPGHPGGAQTGVPDSAIHPGGAAHSEKNQETQESLKHTPQQPDVRQPSAGYLRARLDNLWRLMPSPRRKRTARGRLRDLPRPGRAHPARGAIAQARPHGRGAGGDSSADRRVCRATGGVVGRRRTCPACMVWRRCATSPRIILRELRLSRKRALRRRARQWARVSPGERGYSRHNRAVKEIALRRHLSCRTGQCSLRTW